MNASSRRIPHAPVQNQEELQMSHEWLKRTKWSITLLVALVATTLLALSSPALGAVAAGPCAANPNNRALDFWLGDWTIAAPGGSANATSRVTLELGKCLVVERWDGGRDHIGENLFAYSADDKSWHGMFADNEGRVHVFLNGKAANGSAQFSGPSRDPQGNTILNRVTIHQVSKNHVEQVWEKSSDNRKTWTIAFRGEYARKQH
jgi:hypothetical protein